MADLLPALEALSPGFLSRGVLSIDDLSWVLEHSQWSFFEQAIDATRTHDSGLRAGLVVFASILEHQPRCEAREHTERVRTVLRFILNRLDKLDQWEEYLAFWSLLHDKEVSGLTDEELRYLPDYRRDLIERKLERLRSGKRVGNLLHASPRTLSPAEVKRRLDWLRYVRSVFYGPASGPETSRAPLSRRLS